MRRAAASIAALAGGPLSWADTAAARTPKPKRKLRPKPKPTPPIHHLVVSVQENRSFDHYFGYAPGVQAAGLGPPAGYAQPDAAGGAHKPFELRQLSSPAPNQDWRASHAQFDGGKMDGFFQTAQAYNGDGMAALGYYTANELPFYYSLLDNSALCANYFCSVLGPTLPNRFFLMSGTSGGITTNRIGGYGAFDSERWPIILDLLDAAHVTWKIYNAGGIDDAGDGDNVAVFWSRWARDPRTTATLQDYLADCSTGRLPRVSWVIPSHTHHFDEHPPADVSIGMGLQQQLITALRASPLWSHSAFLLTYDEHGGFFEHTAPPQIDAYGLGMRVPLLVVSPHARKGPIVSARPADHTSTLKLIERLHNLPTLASRNHTFDTRTPAGPDFDGGGAPAPPRDGLHTISDLYDLFTF